MLRRSAVPTSWGGGNVPGPHQVVDLVPSLIEHTGAIEPPHDVLPAVDPGETHVLTDGQSHRSPGEVDLLCDLDAGGRSADYKDPTLPQLTRVPVFEWSQRLDRGGHLGGQGGNVGEIEATTGDGNGRCCPHPPVCDHLPALVIGSQRGDSGVRLDGCAHLAGITIDELDHVGHGHEAVRIPPVVHQPRKTALPVRGEQTQRIPPLGAPGVGHLAALDDNVVDRATAEEVACRQPGVTRANDDGGHPHPGPAQLTSTLTLVGLVITSKTAERF